MGMLRGKQMNVNVVLPSITKTQYERYTCENESDSPSIHGKTTLVEHYPSDNVICRLKINQNEVQTQSCQLWNILCMKVRQTLQLMLYI